MIDFNKFTKQEDVETPTIDFGKFVKAPVKPIIPARTGTLPAFLGGGSYNLGQSGELIRTERGYGSIKAPGRYREHIFPVSLGGTSPASGEQDTELDNIKVYGKDLGLQKSAYENDIIRQYKSGKIELGEARGLVLKKFRELTGLDPKQGTGSYFLEGLKETVLHPWQSFKKIVEKYPQTESTIKEFPGTLKTTVLDIPKTVPDFAKEIKRSWDNAVEKNAEMMLKAGKASVSKQLGTSFEALAANLGLALSPITAAFSASKNIPILGSLASIITAPLAIAGDSMTNISESGIEALVETGKMERETADNIKQGIGELASLAIQIFIAEKTGSGKKANIIREKKPILEKRFGKKDAETIIKKAEEKANVELKQEIKPEAKIDFEKFAKKKEIEKLDIKGKSEKLGDPILQVADNKVAIKLPKNLTKEQRAKIYDEVGTIKDFDKQPVHVSQKRILETPEGKKLDLITLSDAVKKYPEVKRLVDSIGLDTVAGKVQQPITIKPIKEEYRPPQTGDKVSGIAKSIEAKAIEKGLIEEGFEDLASFETTTLKEQARVASEMVKTDINKTRAIVRGEEPLPSGVRGISVIKAMEEVVKKTKDRELAYELANSPLATELSLAAQELSLTRGRTPDSATAKIQQIKKAREKKAGKAVEKKKQIKKDIKKETEKVNLSKEDLSWDKFLEGIKC